jgi:Fe-S-cluster containining protein
MGQVFYEKGLRFECTRCSRCCRHSPGYVFLSAKDVERLSKALGTPPEEFLRVYCRRVSTGIADRISLKEKANFDCIFWENGGCSVYEARPTQCRAYPFWSSNVASREAWEEQAKMCPGIGRGPVHDRREIEQWLEVRRREGFLAPDTTGEPRGARAGPVS